MAIITLSDEYSIKMDDKQFTLRRFTGTTIDKKTGIEKELFFDEGHFGDLFQLFKYYHKLLCVKKADTKQQITIKEYMQIHEQSLAEIKTLLNWSLIELNDWWDSLSRELKEVNCENDGGDI